MLEKQKKKLRRKKRIRSKIKGTAVIPRLSVFRSKKHIYAQLIDDEKKHVIAAADDLKIKIKKTPDLNKRTKKIAIAFEVGKLIAQKALEKKIERVVFDRGGYKYHGRVKALAEGAREGGLKF